MSTNSEPIQKVIEPSFFSNWADLFFPKIANKTIPFLVKIPGITPNIVTITSFLLYTAGCLVIFTNFDFKLYLTAIFLPIAYILDCADGQLARTMKKSSLIGDYLDKVLDVLKIFIITFSLGFYLYLQSGNILYLILGFIACFFFNFRYYIKLETMFSQINNNPDYLRDSRRLRYQLYEDLGNRYKEWSKSIFGKVKVLFYKNRSIVFVDEAEFVVFTSIAALFNRLDIALWIFAISQLSIGVFRIFERAYLIQNNQERLKQPLRK